MFLEASFLLEAGAQLSYMEVRSSGVVQMKTEVTESNLRKAMHNLIDGPARIAASRGVLPRLYVQPGTDTEYRIKNMIAQRSKEKWFSFYRQDSDYFELEELEEVLNNNSSSDQSLGGDGDDSSSVAHSELGDTKRIDHDEEEKIHESDQEEQGQEFSGKTSMSDDSTGKEHEQTESQHIQDLLEKHRITDDVKKDFIDKGIISENRGRLSLGTVFGDAIVGEKIKTLNKTDCVFILDVLTAKKHTLYEYNMKLRRAAYDSTTALNEHIGLLDAEELQRETELLDKPKEDETKGDADEEEQDFMLGQQGAGKSDKESGGQDIVPPIEQTESSTEELKHSEESVINVANVGQHSGMQTEEQTVVSSVV